MKRDQKASLDYWDKWVTYVAGRIPRMWQVLNQEGGEVSYDPKYAFQIAQAHWEQILRKYSRGDTTEPLNMHFPGLLDAWEESTRLGQELFSVSSSPPEESWDFDLDYYIICFWLTGLALTLNIPDEQWERLLALMDNEGKDALLDSVIASRKKGRPIGAKLCFSAAYGKLHDVILAPSEQQPKLLRTYLDGWYASLEKAGPPSRSPIYRRPYWYRFGDSNLEGGAYFGRWCIEAVAVAKAFNIDDTLCLDHPHYPGDLLKDGRSPRYPDTSALVKKNWLGRFFGGKP
ncbi:PoNe immunity protein domain-containing protein [Bordetella trematum]|uniref:PoNe immunity protein domain-containing protein n=1 Tax=Bordetella trematum TaxID=123899 RepID=UPI003989EA6E